MEKLMKRSIVIAVILLTIVQSFFYSVAAASVQPWSGNTWTGDSWNGETWEGTPWQGNTWTGDTWQGDTWQGDGTSGDGTSGDGTSGDGTSGDGTSGDGTSGDGTSGDGTSGDGTSGDGTSSDGTSGDGTSGDGTSGDSTNSKGPDGYEVFNYMAKDVILGQVDLAGNSLTSTNGEMGRQTGSFLVGLALNGLKLGIDSPALEYAADANDAVANGFSAYDAVNTLRNAGSLTQASQTGGTMMAGAVQSAAPAMGALGKLNLVAAIGGTVLGGIDTYNKTFGDGGIKDTFNDSNASGADKTVAVSDATASLGATFMSAGAAVAFAPIPGAQVVGAGIVVGGALLWGASKLTGYVAKNWGSIKSGAAKVSSAVSKGWNAVTGLFG